MKIRIGFVSNSSSSSFIIAIKNESKYEEKILPILKEEFGNLSNEILSQYVSLKKLDKVVGVHNDYSEDGGGIELKTEGRWYGWMSSSKKYHDLVEKGFTIYCGSFSSENESLETVLRDYFKFEIDEDELYIETN